MQEDGSLELWTLFSCSSVSKLHSLQELSSSDKNNWQSLPRRRPRSHYELSSSLNDVESVGKTTRSDTPVFGGENAPAQRSGTPTLRAGTPTFKDSSPAKSSRLISAEEAAFELKTKSSVSLNQIRNRLSRSVLELQLYWFYVFR